MVNDPTAKAIIENFNIPEDELSSIADSVVSIKVQGTKSYNCLKYIEWVHITETYFIKKSHVAPMSNFPSDKPVLVTCGLPYANGKCHIGHLRTYVPGDIFVRSLRKQGQEAVFVCGSDAHGTPIVVNAEG